MLLTSLFALFASGAEDKPATTLSVNVREVLLPVTVRDKHGQFVRNLTKDDFVLTDDGRPEAIHDLTQESDLPLTLGLLVDTSLSQREVLGDEQKASKTFLDRMLATDKDKAFLIHFDREVELLQDLTPSKEKLQSAVDLLETRPASQENSGPGGDDGTGGARRGRRGGTLLYDAIFLASDELMKKQEGRKALIILSDGVDRGSKESLQSAIEAAQRANTMVYSILFANKEREQYGDEGMGRRGGGGMGRGPGGWPGGGSGGGWPGGGGGGGGRRGGGQGYPQEPRPDGKKILEQISKATGGRIFEVTKKRTVDEIYTSIVEELRTQYVLGYVPEKNGSTGYHRLTLTTKKKDLEVQTRDGYFAEQ